MPRALTLLIIGLAAALAACSIPKTEFRATPDGGGADDQPVVLSIVASPGTITVDEGATKDFTVALSQAPSAPLTVSVATTATTKLAISVPTLSFTPANFDQPQTVTVTGLADRDTADEHADVTLTATGVDPVTVTATVHDLDTLQIIASGGNPLTIDEGSQVIVNVHLSAQPSGDVSVTAVLGSGPVTVTPSTRVFTSSNFDADQSFTVKAVTDANTVDETIFLTFRAMNVPDKMVTIEDHDTSVQGLHVDVSPSDATIIEQTTKATLDVALNQQPSQSVTVTVTATGQAHADTTQLTFTPQNYATTQRVTVDAPDDPDTVDGSGTIALHATDPDKGTSLDRSILITVRDNDVQKILEDAPSTLLLTETTPATFNATLAFKPTQNVIVGVSSLDINVATASPGSLTFTPGDYNLPHLVTVTGKHDANLVTDGTSIRLTESTIGTTDVVVSVADVDRQAIKLSTTMLTVPEGLPRTFDVSLMFDPGGTVMATVMSSSAALPASPGTLMFTSGDYTQPHTVTVNPPVDPNNSSETGTVTMSGAGAASSAIVNVTVADSTIIQPWGWPTPFSSTTGVSAGFAFAYPIDVGAGANANLEAFHVYVPNPVGLFRMALYTSVGGNPGHLVAQMGDGKVLGPLTTNDGAPTTNVVLTDPTYFLVVRFSANVNIGYDAPGQALRRCFGNTKYNTISDAWVNDFTDVTCGNDHLFNIWITTYHQ